MTKLTITTKSADETSRLGAQLATVLTGEDVLELVGDLGAGKTQLVRGLASGVNSKDQVQSPSFMLQRIYEGRPYNIHHYDFYRLDQPGVIAMELAESLAAGDSLVAVEWAQSVSDILPERTITIEIEPSGENERQITLSNIRPEIRKALDDFDYKD